MTIDELIIATADEADGLTDPTSVISAAFTKATRTQKDELARRAFVDCVHEIIRARTRVAERRAQQHPPQQPTRPTPSQLAKAKEWYGPGSWKHGSIDKRYGGVTHGCTCDECNAHRAIMEKHDAQLARAMTSILNDYKAELRIEWTADLLASTFSVGDGTFVTWGEATADHHRDRVEMFKANAIANIEGAARHEAALDTLTTTGAPCLNMAVATKAA